MKRKMPLIEIARKKMYVYAREKNHIRRLTRKERNERMKRKKNEDQDLSMLFAELNCDH